jgi:signal-transduction protein with cAMP-binding, CBS, and nucleotidyltransferase domain
MGIDRVLRGHDVFQSLSIEQSHALSEFSALKQLESGETVFKYDVKAGHIYMLMKGAVELRLPAQQNDFSMVISKVEIGELFGLSPLLDSPRYTTTAECTAATEVLSIEARPLRELLRQNQHVGFEIINQVAHIYFSRYIEVLKNFQSIVNQISLIH